jgi:hypothetical protein
MFCSIKSLEIEKLLAGKIVAVDLYCGANRKAITVDMMKEAIEAIMIGFLHLRILMSNCSEEVLISI